MLDHDAIEGRIKSGKILKADLVDLLKENCWLRKCKEAADQMAHELDAFYHKTAAIHGAILGAVNQYGIISDITPSAKRAKIDLTVEEEDV